ncbi:O-methyltransferase [Sneathiella sp.]|uniref:O-methyltransferase n=1 Tax=Sneathiella sp. TaxID=1964365 RepID=UPI0030017A23
MRGDPASVARAIDGYAQSASGMIHLGRDKGILFDQVVAQSGAHRILELGTNFGYSVLRLAKVLGSQAEIHSVEVDRSLADTAEAIISYAGLSGQITVHRGASQNVLDCFTTPFDLIFIDHFPQNYLPDLLKIEERGLLQEGGTLISDNVVLFGADLEPYLHHLRQSGRYHSSLHQPRPGADGFEVSIRCGERSTDTPI